MTHLGVGHYATHGDVMTRRLFGEDGKVVGRMKQPAPAPTPKVGDVRIIELRPGYWLRERFEQCPCPDCRTVGHWAGEISGSRREQVEE